MSVKNKIRELIKIKAEIKRLNASIKELRSKSSELEGDIIEYLETKEEEIVKCDDIIISISNKNGRQRRKEKEKRERGIEILSSYRGKDPEEMIQILMEQLKGDPYVKPVLKFKQIKEKI